MALGKRKERAEDTEAAESHGSTFFVSNMPYNATSTDLQTLFSEIAPVRNAFIVTEHGTGVSKGVGYVSFSMREDALTAYDQIAKEGITLVGRKLRVQWAEQKSKVKKENTEGGEHVPKKSRPASHHRTDKGPHDPLAIRTIVIAGLPGSIDSKTLWKKVRKYDGAEKVEWPVESEDTSTAYAVFSTPSAAQDAISKLHAHVFKGSLLSVTLKKRLDSLPSHKPTSTPATATAVVVAPTHANRLIVRNLPFSATESDLRSVFLPYGPIYTMNMPLKDVIKEDNKAIKTEEEDEGATSTAVKAPKNKGFAFVWYYYRKDAERAMEKCNGMTLRAGTAEELVTGKQKRKKERRLEKKLALLRERGGDDKVEDEEEVSDEDDETKEEKKDTKTDRNERVIAVDWALSKDRWEEEKAKFEELNEVKSEGASDGESGSESDVEGFGVHHEDDDGSSKASDEEDDDEDKEGERDEEDDQPVKPQLPQTDIGTTLFIRNLPYDATEDELRTLFRSFGPLRYARITVDQDTNRSRGTGFACFWNKEDADKVVQQSELLRAETTGGTVSTVPKKNPFTLPSILTPDPSSSLAQNLVLHGRSLDVVRAVTRDEAGKLAEAGERAREKADKRNMYLLREGAILPNNPEASSLSPADLERRTNSYNARRALLRSNPSLYISKTRLSVRQIPVYVTDLMLKRLALHATRAFEKEVKQGKRSGLSTAELEVLPGQTQEEEEADSRVDGPHDGSDAESEKSGTSAGTTLSKGARRKAKLRQRFEGRKGGVKQAKIVRQADRVDPITGKGKSRGYGFVEMSTHADALRVLRWTNNNLDVPRLLREWWREELERLTKIEREKLKKGKSAKVGENDDDEETREAREARLKRMMNELEKQSQREDKKKASGGSGDKEAGGDEKHRALTVEFSIENIQVVQRRNAIQKNKSTTDKKELEGKKMLDDGRQHQQTRAGHRSHTASGLESFESRSSKTKGGKRVRDNERDGSIDELRRGSKGRKQGQPEKKRQRLSTIDSPESAQRVGKPKEDDEPFKAGQKVGSIIGRKRKERRERGRKGKA